VPRRRSAARSSALNSPEKRTSTSIRDNAADD
jgi:hypothetical protein